MSKHIVLLQRANGEKMSPKPMKMPDTDAERLVAANRAHYISKTVYAFMTGKASIEAVKTQERTEDRRNRRRMERLNRQ